MTRDERLGQQTFFYRIPATAKLWIFVHADLCSV
jgi:hypothetical protein